jgi:hypothetical protein
MKKVFSLAILLLFFSSIVCAQNCNNYLLLQNNKKVEMTVYNKKGKENGKQVWNVSNVKTEAGSTVATVNSEFFNERGKSLNKSTSEIKCSNGALMMDMKLMLGEDQLKQMGDAAAKAKGDMLEYPAVVNVNDVLKDGNLTIAFTMGGSMDATMEINVSERKVTGKESVTSPAGTWECYTVTSKQKITTKIAGIGVPFKADITEWYAPGVGIVKTESKYGSTLITALQ